MTTDPETSRAPDLLQRATSGFLDGCLGMPFSVLDHGFVRVVDYMGNEDAIVQSARVSYGEGTKTVSTDRGLLRYLMKHWHTTPYEMCEIKLHVKLPVFVARQWIRHRTANVNEISARYSILDREFYIPENENILPQSKSNKQGREGELPLAYRDSVRQTLDQISHMSYEYYQELLHGWPWFYEDGTQKPGHVDPDDPGPHTAEQGIARELARMALTPNVYTQWYWKVDLHNLLHFLRLRADPHAQFEIRAYANVICDLMEGWVPNVWEAFENYQMKATTLSWAEMELLREFIAPHVEMGIPLKQGSGLTIKEHRELEMKLGVPDAGEER